MPQILFAVDSKNKVKVLKVERLENEYFVLDQNDIEELEVGLFREDEDYSMGIYKGELQFIHGKDCDCGQCGYWEIRDNFKLITNIQSECLED